MKLVIVGGAAGYRSYVANRMLTQRGFRARTVSGGTGMYVNFRDAGMLR
jgi:hypothetical protein